MSGRKISISVIIPVYNVEKYLRCSLDSICTQTYTDWECILVDDGSIDASGLICDEYELKDSRIRVFHKENGGVSSARNLGLDNATGDWILFVDADDYIVPTCLETLVRTIENNDVDVLQFSYFRVNEKGDVIEQGKTEERICRLSSNDYVKTRKMLFTVWGNFFNRECVDDVRFIENLKLGEDQVFIMQIVDNAQYVMRINEKLYGYRINPNSATHNVKTEDAFFSILKFAEINELYPQYKYRIDDQIVQFFFVVLKTNAQSEYVDVLKIVYDAQQPKISFYHTYKKNIFIVVANWNFNFACQLFSYLSHLQKYF